MTARVPPAAKLATLRAEVNVAVHELAVDVNEWGGSEFAADQSIKKDRIWLR